MVARDSNSLYRPSLAVFEPPIDVTAANPPALIAQASDAGPLAGPLSDDTYDLLDGIANPADLRRLSADELPQLCHELRDALIQTVSKTGGHLGSGLGVVELTVALHFAFNTPGDKLIWDVSHQCYPHKMLTGRRAGMSTLRQADGLSGFTTRTESVFDPFGAAHSSTAISAALGFAVARDLKREVGHDDRHVVAIVGDGAASGGMAFEGLNNLGAERRRVIVILNDNNMSIAPPSGALVTHLSNLRSAMPSPADRRTSLQAGTLQNFTGGPTLFDHFGVTYAGPFDGHDVAEMVTALELAKRFDGGPILLHVVTEKGHGYQAATDAADCYHGVGCFNAETGALEKGAKAPPSYTKVFSQALIREAEADDRVVAVTAAMPTGTGLDAFGKRFPDRCFDAGIAEQHAVTFAAGLACEGLKPFVAIYSTFLQRGFDQVVHDVAIQRLPVRFAIDRAGLVGADGVTHQGAYDVTYLGCIPGFVLMAAADEAELVHMIATAAAIDDRPCAFRYPRGNGTGVAIPDIGQPLEVGRGRIVKEGTDVAIISYGTTLGRALAAAARLDEAGISTTVADARFAKPLDKDLIDRLSREHALLVTLEEGAIGGFATHVMEHLASPAGHLAADRLGRHTLHTARRPGQLGGLLALHLPDHFIEHGTQAEQEAWAGLDAKSIARRIARAHGRRQVGHLLAAE